jgi:hypothetical protein
VTNGLPVGASITAGGAAGDEAPNGCYGVDWDTNSSVCKLVVSVIPTGNRSAGSGFECHSRDSTRNAAALVTAQAASASG